tara:strand:+ start:2317 stop:2790 length:474 start_codon:yes stop_codon:yes gene_type:complete
MANKQLSILNKLLTQIEINIPFKEKRNPSVSKSDVAWQLGHALKVINHVLSILEKTEPDKYQKKFNIKRSILLSLGWFPRGKVKAPSFVTPPELILEEDLHAQLESANTHLNNLKLVAEKAFFIHHIFGMLSKVQTLRFLEIHTKHHLKIVNDIMKK